MQYCDRLAAPSVQLVFESFFYTEQTVQAESAAPNAAQSWLPHLSTGIPHVEVDEKCYLKADHVVLHFRDDVPENWYLLVIAGAWLLAGYSAASFLYDMVLMLVELDDVALCDEAKLQDMGQQFAGSIGTLAEELLASAVLGGLGKLSGAVRDAAQYAGDGAWAQ